MENESDNDDENAENDAGADDGADAEVSEEILVNPSGVAAGDDGSKASTAGSALSPDAAAAAAAGDVEDSVIPFPSDDEDEIPAGIAASGSPEYVLASPAAATNESEYGVISISDGDDESTDSNAGEADGFNESLSGFGRAIVDGAGLPVRDRAVADESLSGFDVSRVDDSGAVLSARDRAPTNESLSGFGAAGIDGLPVRDRVATNQSMYGFGDDGLDLDSLEGIPTQPTSTPKQVQPVQTLADPLLEGLEGLPEWKQALLLSKRLQKQTVESDLARREAELEAREREVASAAAALLSEQSSMQTQAEARQMRAAAMAAESARLFQEHEAEAAQRAADERQANLEREAAAAAAAVAEAEARDRELAKLHEQAGPDARELEPLPPEPPWAETPTDVDGNATPQKHPKVRKGISPRKAGSVKRLAGFMAQHILVGPDRIIGEDSAATIPPADQLGWSRGRSLTKKKAPDATRTVSDGLSPPTPPSFDVDSSHLQLPRAPAPPALVPLVPPAPPPPPVLPNDHLDFLQKVSGGAASAPRPFSADQLLAGRESLQAAATTSEPTSLSAIGPSFLSELSARVKARAAPTAPVDPLTKKHGGAPSPNAPSNPFQLELQARLRSRSESKRDFDFDAVGDEPTQNLSAADVRGDLDAANQPPPSIPSDTQPTAVGGEQATPKRAVPARQGAVAMAKAVLYKRPVAASVAYGRPKAVSGNKARLEADARQRAQIASRLTLLSERESRLRDTELKLKAVSASVSSPAAVGSTVAASEHDSDGQGVTGATAAGARKRLSMTDDPGIPDAPMMSFGAFADDPAVLGGGMTTLDKRKSSIGEDGLVTPKVPAWKRAYLRKMSFKGP